MKWLPYIMGAFAGFQTADADVTRRSHRLTLARRCRCHQCHNHVVFGYALFAIGARQKTSAWKHSIAGRKVTIQQLATRRHTSFTGHQRHTSASVIGVTTLVGRRYVNRLRCRMAHYHDNIRPKQSMLINVIRQHQHARHWYRRWNTRLLH